MVVIPLGFSKVTWKDLVYYTVPRFENTGLVRVVFTTRLGGVSNTPFNSLNLGIKKKDSKESIYQNYQILSRATGIPVENMVLSDQIHGDKIVRVGEKDIGKDFFNTNRISGVDGLITNEKEVALVTFYADCVPLFFLDPIQKAIGLTHAGWRGTIKGIGRKTIKKMEEEFYTKPENCLVAIGPSIGPCCFEVGKDVVEKINIEFTKPEQYYTDKGNGKYMVDLWKLNQNQLMEAGIHPQNVELSKICTKCNRDIFFSHRGDQGNTGSLAAVLMLI